MKYEQKNTWYILITRNDDYSNMHIKTAIRKI